MGIEQLMSMTRKNSGSASLANNRTPEQKKVIAYLTNPAGGCGKKVGGMSDDEFDSLVQQKLNLHSNIDTVCNNYLGIDKDECNEIEPIHFWGYRFDDAYSRMRNDGSFVSSQIEDTWIFFSNNQIYVFWCNIWLDEDKKETKALEYFYKDVTSFSISEKESTKASLSMPSLGCKKPSVTTQKITSNRFFMVVPDASFDAAFTNSPEILEQIQGMRAKLREKKI
ncbi:MAG: hypothetical protein MJY98_09345 [Fibrobacter sp.]|nr:hypothetical protein [Fibrobacter sp.]